MKLTEHGEVILNEQDIFEGLYSGKITSLANLNIDNPDLIAQFNKSRTQNADPVPNIQQYEPWTLSQTEFDKSNQEQWFMPDEYRTYDIVDYLYSQCRTIEQKDRVTDELRLFAQHNMIMLLKYLKYLVDTMRTNSIVWGVGRGSSVASYCLYLLGVHKIDSIKYKLDIHEFLKES
jgi:DNA polymerase III alpha subunit